MAIVGLVLGVAVITALALLREKPLAPLPRARPPERPPTNAAVETGTNRVTAPASATFAKLKGVWLRTDGDYTLDVQRVGEDGKAEVKYLNPGPIHVAGSEAKQDGAGIELSVKLEDTGYPGCIYRLRYDGKQDELEGTYYQAAMQETFDVRFVRSK